MRKISEKKKAKQAEMRKEAIEGRFYTFPNKFRLWGVILVVADYLTTLILRFYFKDWVATHHEIYLTGAVALILTGFSFIVMAKRKAGEDYTKHLLDRTNWFILRFIIFNCILSYILVEVEHLPLGYDAFLITMLLTYFSYYQIIKYKYEKLGKDGEGED